jgi:hypothetical protein
VTKSEKRIENDNGGNNGGGQLQRSNRAKTGSSSEGR